MYAIRSYYVLPKDIGPFGLILLLPALAAVLSGFMNNVGALALLMPVAISAAQRAVITSYSIHYTKLYD